MSEIPAYIREVCIDDEVTLHIEQLIEGEEGCVVWDAALVLISFIKRLVAAGQLDVNVGHVLDLGSGTGVVGLATSRICSPISVTLTDMDTQVELIARNAERNRAKTEIHTRTLAWDSEKDICALMESAVSYSLITASDCVYGDKSSAPLALLINRLLEKYPFARVFMSYEKRERHRVEVAEGVDHSADFFKDLKAFGCKVDVIPISDHGEFNAVDIALYCIHKPRNDTVAKLTAQTKIAEKLNYSEAKHVDTGGCSCGCVPNIKSLFEMAKLRAEHRAKQSHKKG
jgi:hypothetical protein